VKVKFTFGLVLFVLAAVAVGNYLWPETCERPPQGVLIIGEEPAHWNEWTERERQEWTDQRNGQAAFERCLKRGGIAKPAR